MANLTDLFPVEDYVVGSDSRKLEQIYVYNTNLTTQNNGGACCQFTVPDGVTWARFEVWGGGGNGPGGCCCQQPAQAGGAGAYARKTILVDGGDTYTVCAGGTGCCTCSCCGAEGYPSFVQDDTVSTGQSIALCASGGPVGCGRCFMFSSCRCIGQTCVYCLSESACGYDFAVPKISGASRPYWCGRGAFQWVPQGPIVGGGFKSSQDYCCTGRGEEMIRARASFPGGGGAGAQTGGDAYCYGDLGAGGLVIITYR